MDFSKFLHGFVKSDTWISLNGIMNLLFCCSMDLSKLFYFFLTLCVRLIFNQPGGFWDQLNFVTKVKVRPEV